MAVFRSNGKFFAVANRCVHKGASPRLDDLPFPAWDLVDLALRDRFSGRVVQHLGRGRWAFPIDGRHPSDSSQFLGRLEGVELAAARFDPRKLAVGAKPDDALRIGNHIVHGGRQSRSIRPWYLEVGDGSCSPVDPANAPVGVRVEIVGKPDMAVEVERAVHRMVIPDVELRGRPQVPEAAIVEER